MKFRACCIPLLSMLLADGSHAFSSCSIPTRHVVAPQTNHYWHVHHLQQPIKAVTTTPPATALCSSRGPQVEGTDRILSCLPYLLPLMDGDRYGRFIFALFPALGMANALLLGPFQLAFSVIPFGQLIAFIGLSILSRNPQLSRPVRFNMQQALILDILLIFPSLLGSLGNISMPRIVVESGSNFVFYILVATVGYSLVSNLTGKLPNQIPLVSETSEMQIGPF